MNGETAPNRMSRADLDDRDKTAFLIALKDEPFAIDRAERGSI